MLRGVHRRFASSLSSWATVDPVSLSGKTPGKTLNLVRGQWKETQKTSMIIDPLNGEKFIEVSMAQVTLPLSLSRDSMIQRKTGRKRTERDFRECVELP